jgi:acetylornithine deacetylase/succinyl-diaminopimelate desuccinylase-like protein
VLGVGISACSKPRPKPPPVEQLLKPLDEARRDSAVASAAAAAVGLAPQVAAALTVVAAQRTAHARALSTEISRVTNKPIPPTSETTRPSPGPTGAAAPPPPPPAVSDVIDTLRASAESANRLVATSSGYRAGLLASIAASCTASCTVALVPGGPSI